jgi:hypothetical protein
MVVRTTIIRCYGGMLVDSSLLFKKNHVKCLLGLVSLIYFLMSKENELLANQKAVLGLIPGPNGGFNLDCILKKANSIVVIVKATSNGVMCFLVAFSLNPIHETRYYMLL